MYSNKIASETEKTQQGIQELSSGIKTQREIEQLGDIDVDDSTPPPPEPEERERETQRGVSFIDKFTETAIEKIREDVLNKPKDYATFGDFAIKRYYSRGDFLKDEYKKT